MVPSAYACKVTSLTTITNKKAKLQNFPGKKIKRRNPDGLRRLKQSKIYQLLYYADYLHIFRIKQNPNRKNIPLMADIHMAVVLLCGFADIFKPVAVFLTAFA